MAQILLVDDEPDILKMLKALLENDGHTTVEALGGEQGRSLILAGEFDLMICDLRMTPIDGMQLLKLAHEKRPNTPVIMLTAYGRVDVAVESMQSGAFDFIKKPFKADELLSTVKRALACHDYMKSS